MEGACGGAWMFEHAAPPNKCGQSRAAGVSELVKGGGGGREEK